MSERRRTVFWFDPRPDDVHFAVEVGSVEAFDLIVARGYARVDSQIARPVLADCDRESLFMRFRFDHPYVKPGQLRAVA